MKTCLLAILIFCCCSTHATNYYFSASSGDDNRSATQAQNSGTPWKTINKLNSFFGSLQPGDQILFKRGDVFYGSAEISRSGTSGNRIVFDAYGSGADPVITGFSTVSSWKNLGKNIWESSAAVSAKATASVVLVNGVLAQMGRYPNSGFLTYQSFSGNKSITSSSIKSGGTNWTGAEAVIKKTRWILDRNHITSQSGGTLAYSGGGYVGRNNYGFFIQNDARTLDVQNEWYYNPSTKKIRLYSSGSPSNVQVSSIDMLVHMVNSNYITFNNISFTGANDNAFWISGCSNLNIQQCDFQFCNNGIAGKDNGGSSANFVFQNSTINHTNNNAINLSEEFTAASLSNNTIKNTAIIPGAGASGDGNYIAVSLQSPNCSIKYNTIDEVGYHGIAFFGSSFTVSNNLVSNFCRLKSDGGGIYTQGINSNMTIANNIIINGIIKEEGVFNPVGVSVIAIYCDGTVTDIHILNNTIANSSYAGIYIHNPTNIEVKNNTIYNCNYTGLLVKNDENSITMRNLAITGNIFFARDASQRVSHIITLHNDISKLGTFDNNYYARPIDDNLVIGVQPFGEDVNATLYNLAQWKSYSKLDGNSLKSPRSITNLNDLRFEYNASQSDKTISLGASYIDVTGKGYSGNTVLKPYTSLVLIKTGASQNNAPAVNITGPANNTNYTSPASINITANASDDGSITKVDFYNGSDLIGTDFSSPYSFTWKNVAAGNYTLTAKATDNTGLFTISGEVAVSVSKPANGSPAVSITSPSDNSSFTSPASINITANASDDGSITEVDFYSGSDLIGADFSSPYSFTWKNVDAGNYTLTAKATDNSGLTTLSSPVSVLVSAPGNGNPPLVNITAPDDKSTYAAPATIDMVATATDVGGSIKKVEFFNGSTLLKTEGTSPYTYSWKNVKAGIYTITAKATDNSGLTTTSSAISVTVTGAGNKAPTVTITKPGANASFTSPANIDMIATAKDADGSIKTVQFFNGTTLLKTEGTNPYTYSWKNVKAGNYTLTAKATDNGGLTTTSAAVHISVKAKKSSKGSSAANPLGTIATQNIRLFPNPAFNSIQIYFDRLQAYQKSTLTIYNATGAIIKAYTVIISGKKIDVDISSLTTGIYFVGLSGHNFRMNKKFIKVK